MEVECVEGARATRGQPTPLWLLALIAFVAFDALRGSAAFSAGTRVESAPPLGIAGQRPPPSPRPSRASLAAGPGGAPVEGARADPLGALGEGIGLGAASRSGPAFGAWNARRLRRLPGIAAARALAWVDARWSREPGAAPLYLDDLPGVGPATQARVREWAQRIVPLSEGAGAAEPADAWQ